MKLRSLCIFVAVLALGGCATGYQQQSASSGGYSETETKPGVWHVAFAGNGYTNKETLQTFWLYRSAELTLAKGYQGFEITSDTKLDENPGEVTPTWSGATNGAAKPLDLTAKFEGDLRLIKGAVKANPPKVFDAAALKADLDPIVHAKGNCGTVMEGHGNVCPHRHGYLFPSEAMRH